MTLSDFFKPKWRRSDPQVRKQAVAVVNDPSILARVALTDDDPDVRSAATGRIADETVLEQIAASDSSEDVRAIAVGKITNEATLRAFATGESVDYGVRVAAIEKLQDQGVLSRIALDVSDDCRSAAIERVHSSDSGILVSR